MRTIQHLVDIDAPPAAVYRAVSSAAGLAGWWSTAVSADERVGGVVDLTFGGDFNPEMEITELTHASAVGWRCVGGHEPWAGSTFRFALAGCDDGTRLRFWQYCALELDDDRFAMYNFNWGYYLESLRLYCETGTGRPFDPSVSARLPT
jgi:uncharacterized protein YndB with AHSA1/START domain